MSLNEKILAYFYVNNVPASSYKSKYLTGVHNDGPEEILQWNTEVLGDIPSQEMLDAAKAQFDLEVKAQDVRKNRSKLLADTDWVVIMHTEKGTNIPMEWEIYRQALRDVPEQPGFPFDVTWPEKPAS